LSLDFYGFQTLATVPSKNGAKSNILWWIPLGSITKFVAEDGGHFTNGFPFFDWFS
jgi:hypothetical protein